MTDQPRFKPFTLTFDEPLESEFLAIHYHQSIRQMRLGIFFGLFLYASFGAVDVVALPSELRAVWIMRYGIVSPLLAGLLIWSYRPSFRKFAQSAVTLVSVIAGVSIIAMTMIAPKPANYLYHTGLLVVIMYVFSFMRLRFIYALGASVFLVAAYNVGTIIVGDTPAWIIINNNYYLATSLVLGGFAGYSMERYARRNFIQSRTIAARSKELEEKNAELVAANRELIESKVAVVESSKRAQLIFNALAEALPGTVLEEKYEIGEKIGSGGFGTVYRGKHLLLDAPVAIKIFRPTSAKDLEKSLERFRREGMSAKRINHPNAVAVLDFGISAGAIAFLIMELLHGRSLAEELHEIGRLPARRCAEIAVPVCSVLADAHRKGIMHRDIKPGNIFLHRTVSGEVVKVVDFGIAKLVEPTADRDATELTATGALVGTLSYMSPERLEGAQYGTSSDVYSIGVVMYQMLTGKLPFQSTADAYWRAALRHVDAPAPSPRDVQPDVPLILNDLVTRALSPAPDRRPTAFEIADTIAAEFGVPLPVVYTAAETLETAAPVKSVRDEIDDAPTVIDQNETTVKFKRV